LAKPGVSIVWVNYNSMGFIDLALRSLDAIAQLNYDNYELIVVDNGSSDGFYEAIKSRVGELGIDARVIRLERNLGFAGGNNVGFLRMSSDSEYFVAINNDAIPEKNSLARIVEYMERKPCIGASQGIILDLRGGGVDALGCYVDEILRISHPFSSRRPEEVIDVLPAPVTYANGAYMVVRVESIYRCGLEVPFPWEGFLSLDDNFLGPLLWSRGYKVYGLPVIAGWHRGGFTVKKSPLSLYYGLRGWVAMGLITNSRYRDLIPGVVLSYALRKAARDRRYVVALRGALDGVSLSKRLSGYVDRLDIYRGPIIPIDPIEIPRSFITLRGFDREVEELVASLRGSGERLA